MHSSVCLGLPGASGAQTCGQPPGALVQAATPGGLAGLTAFPADKGGRRASGVARRCPQALGGLGSLCGPQAFAPRQGESSGRGRGWGRSTHPGSRGARGLCACLFPRSARGQGVIPGGTPRHGGGRLRSGGSSQVSPAQPPPHPGPQPRSQQPRRLTVVTGPQGRLSGEAWPRMPCPHSRPYLARAWGLVTRTSARVCIRHGVCVCLCISLFSELSALVDII